MLHVRVRSKDTEYSYIMVKQTKLVLLMKMMSICYIYDYIINLQIGNIKICIIETNIV